MREKRAIGVVAVAAILVTGAIALSDLLMPSLPDDDPARSESRRGASDRREPSSDGPVYRTPEDVPASPPATEPTTEETPGTPRDSVLRPPIPSPRGADHASPIPVPDRAVVPPNTRPLERLGAVAAPRPVEMRAEDLVERTLDGIRGTVVLTGERRAETETGVPVELRGRVVEADSGLPVAGAVVLLHSAFYQRAFFYDHHLEEVARVVTDADGLFLVERLDVDPVHFGRGGRVYLSVRSDLHASLPPIPLDGVKAGYRNRVVDLVLERRRHTVRGRVIDRWEGKPVAGGRVVCTGEIDPIRYPKDQREILFLSSPQAETDEEGRFVLENVGPGRQMISVHGGDDCAGYLSIIVPMKGEVVIRARQIRGRIEGRVLDELDRPVPLVRIDGGDNTTHSFADGRFVLENFRGNEVTLSLTHPDHRPATRPGVLDGSRDVVVRLTGRWPLVRFRVRGHGSDEPIPVISVALRLEGEGTPPVAASPFYVSGEGVHAIRIPDGTVRATISAEGFLPAEVDLAGVRHEDVVPVVLRRE